LTPSVGDPLTLPGAFTVEPGTAPELWVQILSPPVVRRLRPFTVTVPYGNRGNVDAGPGGVWVAFPKELTWTVLGAQVPAAILATQPDKTVLRFDVDFGGPQDAGWLQVKLTAPAPSAASLTLNASGNSAAEVRRRLEAGGFTFNHDECPPGQSHGCTSAGGMQCFAVNGLLEFIKWYGGCLEITGGSEAHAGPSDHHAQGIAADLQNCDGDALGLDLRIAGEDLGHTHPPPPVQPSLLHGTAEFSYDGFW